MVREPTKKRRALASSPHVSASDDKPRLRDGLLPLGKGCSSVARAPTREPRIAVAGALRPELVPAVAGAVGPELVPAVAGAVGPELGPAVAGAIGAELRPAVTGAIGAELGPAVTRAVGAGLRPAVTRAVGAELRPAVTGASGGLLDSGRGDNRILIRDLGAEGQRDENGENERLHYLYQFLHERTPAASEIYRISPFFCIRPEPVNERRGEEPKLLPPPGIHDEKSVTQRGQLIPGQG